MFTFLSTLNENLVILANYLSYFHGHLPFKDNINSNSGNKPGSLGYIALHLGFCNYGITKIKGVKLRV